LSPSSDFGVRKCAHLEIGMAEVYHGRNYIPVT
jgi:hypothetical protein